MSILTAMRRALIVALAFLAVSACGGRGGPAPAPTGGLTVTAGDGQVVITWTPDPGVQYWLFYAPTASISKDNLSASPGHKGLINVTSPYILTGLTNGQLYSFTMDGRYDGGPGGPGTPSVAATPRLAGASWTASGATMSGAMGGVAWGAASNGVKYYLAAGASGALYSSTDGVTTNSLNWTAITGSGVTANLNTAIYTLSKFIVAGDSGKVYSSADLSTWTAGTLAGGSTSNLHAITSNGSTMVVVGDAGTIQSSGDGVTWTAAASVPSTSVNLYGVSYLATGVWMAVGQNCTLWTSSDASNWTAVTVAGCSATDLKGVAYRAATTITTTLPSATTSSYAASYVIVGNGGAAYSSTDGSSWVARTSNTGANLLTLSSTPNQFLAMGAAGAVVTSPDGLNWTAQSSVGNTISGLTNAQGQYVAVGAAGSSYYSR